MKEIWRFYQTHRLDRPSMSRLTQDGDGASLSSPFPFPFPPLSSPRTYSPHPRLVAVVVGRGKTGWNRLLGRPGILASSLERSSSLSRKEAAAAAAAALRGTDLRAQAAREEREENGERRWVEECARAKRKRQEEEEKRRVVAVAQTAEREEGGAVGSATLAFEESGIVAAAPAASVIKEDPKKLAGEAAEERRVGEEAKLHDGIEDEEEEEVLDATHDMFAGAGKFLLAGGMAGAGSSHSLSFFFPLRLNSLSFLPSSVVSRTATAPFDRLKVYLITSPGTPRPPPEPTAPGTKPKKRPRANAGSLTRAVKAVYQQGGGIKSFWTGNGLNIIKIFPVRSFSFLFFPSLDE